MNDKMIIGVFQDRVDAEDAIQSLETYGYNPKDLSIVMKDKQQATEIGDNTGVDVGSSAVSGATTGTVLGALAGLLVGTGVIPGLGALLIGGPIAAALGLTGAAAATISGAVTGALAGGLVGILTGLGLSEEDAKIYQESIEAGGILVAVPAMSGEEGQVREVLENTNADQIKTIDQSETTSHIKRTRSRADEDMYASSMGAKGGKVTDLDEDDI